MERINKEPYSFFGKVGVTGSCQADRQVALVGLARSRGALEGLRWVGDRRGEQGKGDGAGPSIPPAFSQH